MPGRSDIYLSGSFPSPCAVNNWISQTFLFPSLKPVIGHLNTALCNMLKVPTLHCCPSETHQMGVDWDFVLPQFTIAERQPLCTDTRTKRGHQSHSRLPSDRRV